jgi:hypothetical protein
MLRRCSALTTAAALVLLLAAADPPAAAGHGPCGCLDPVLTEVRAKVRITGGPGLGQAAGRGWPAYKVIFNPRPTDLGIAPAYLTSAYRPDAPTVTVLSRSRKDPTRRGSFRVPSTPDGLYMVLIFDGEEAAHTTLGITCMSAIGTGATPRSNGPPRHQRGNPRALRRRSPTPRRTPHSRHFLEASLASS